MASDLSVEVGDVIAEHIARLRRDVGLVDEAQITVIWRVHGHPEAEMLVTRDDLDEVAAVVERMRAREVSSPDPLTGLEAAESVLHDAPDDDLLAAAEGPALPREEPAGYVVLQELQPAYLFTREVAEQLAKAHGGVVHAVVIARPLAEGE